MKILVTGGAGYIGSHTVQALQEKGYEVVVYDNLSTGHEWAVKNCELTIGDLNCIHKLEGDLNCIHKLEGDLSDTHKLEGDLSDTHKLEGDLNCIHKLEGDLNCIHKLEGDLSDTHKLEGDLSDTHKLEQVFDNHKIDAVVHFAASSLVGESVINPAKYYENNVVGSKRLFDVMLSKGVNKLVFSSTCAVYGLPEIIPITEKEKQCPINSYGWTKFMIERIMQDYGKAYGLDSIALRYFNAAGSSYEAGLGEAHNPESHVIPLLLETITGKREMFSLFGQDYDTADGSCIRDYVHVKDLASAHIMAVEKLLGINDFGQKGFKSQSSEYINQQAAEDQRTECIDKQRFKHLKRQRIEKTDFEQKGFDCFNLGTGEGVSVLELISAVEKATGKKVPVKICERREGDPAVLVADNSKAVKVLGWKPIHSDIKNIVNSAYKWELMKDFCVGENIQNGNRIL